MAIAVSNPNFKYTDSAVTATLSPAFSSPYVPYWELNNGTVSAQELNTVTLLPLNRTSNSILTAFAALPFEGNSTLGSSMYWFSGVLRKDAGSETSIAYHSASITTLTNKTVWMEAGNHVAFVEKSFGFTSGINAGSYDCVWYTYGSTAQCNIGSNVIKRVTVEEGDRLKVKIVNGKQALFYKNGIVVAEHWFYPIMTQAYLLMRIGNAVEPTRFFRPIIYVGYPSETASVQVYGVFPTQPNYPYDRVPESYSLLSIGENGNAEGLLKSGKHSLPLNFNPRPREEMKLVKDFCDYHDTVIPFYFPDLIFEEEILMRITSWRITVVREQIWSGNVNLIAF